jgi:hypothetical protein
VQFLASNGSNAIFLFACTVTQAAATAITYNFADVPQQMGTAGNQLMVAAPSDLYLPAGYTLQTLTVNIQAGDQWGPLYYEVEEWIQS